MRISLVLFLRRVFIFIRWNAFTEGLKMSLLLGVLKWTWNYFQIKNVFNTFQQSWKVFMHSVCLSVCLSVHALTLVNILQMSWNWYMLFMSDIAWTVLKMVYIRLMVCLQRHTKVFRYITVYGEENFKGYLNIFILP